jgi:hypothetical protein
MIKIYISGKISGLSESQYRLNFRRAIWQLEMMFEHQNYAIINPLNIHPLFGIKKWFFYMIKDLRAQKKCTYSAFQNNWKESRGAVIEYYFAKFIFKHEIIFL